MRNGGVSSLIGEVYPDPLVAPEDAFNPEPRFRNFEPGASREGETEDLAGSNCACVRCSDTGSRLNDSEARGDELPRILLYFVKRAGGEVAGVSAIHECRLFSAEIKDAIAASWGAPKVEACLEVRKHENTSPMHARNWGRGVWVGA